MIRLNLKKDPWWLELPGYRDLRLLVRPFTLALRETAAAKARALLDELKRQRADVLASGVPAHHLPDLDDPAVRAGWAEALYVKALATAAIADWQGVYQADGETPARPTEAAIGELMDVVGSEFFAAYIASAVAGLAEKNASGPAPDGTGAAGPTTAPGATRTGRLARKVSRGRGGASVPTKSTAH